ncbi:unnamed protein product [Arctogadus glacialis]
MIPRHAGPQYAAHDLSKGHPGLACTPPNHPHPGLACTPPHHPHSAALSQVSLATASAYRYPKGWETGPGSPYNPVQNPGSAPLVYSTQTQPMNAQPQSRPRLLAEGRALRDTRSTAGYSDGGDMMLF